MTPKWPRTKLGDVCQVIAGQSPEGHNYNDIGDGLPFYQGKKEFGSKFLREPKVWTRQTTKSANAGDIVMSVRAPVGPVNIVREKSCIGRGLAALQVKEMLDRDFLYYFLDMSQDRIMSNEGTVFPSINKAQIEAIDMPLPPLDEQKRIVSKLDEVLGFIENATQIKLQSIETHADLLNSVHDKELHSINDQRLVALDTLAVVKTGPFGSVLHKSDYADEGVPIVNPINMIGGSITVDKRVNIGVASRLSSYKLDLGDVVVARRGELGRCAVVDENSVGFLCGTGSFFVRCKRELSPEFLREWLSSRSTVANLMKMSTGTTMDSLSNTQLASLKIPLHTPEVQQEILVRMREIRNFAQSQSGIARQGLESLEALRASILLAAFAGDF